MSVFTTKVNGQKVTVVAQNVAFVADVSGNAEIHFTNGAILGTDVGYDSVRKNVAKSLGKPAEDKAE
jgi:hypothetical protein